LNYNRKFDDDRKSLSAVVSSSFEKNRENTNITTQSLSDSDVKIGDPFLQFTHNYEDVNLVNAMVDYVFPVCSNATLGTGYKGMYRSLKNDYLTSNKVNNDYVVNPLASNIFDFNEQVHAAYIQYNAFIGEKVNPHWKYSAGLRAEQVFNNGKTIDKSTTFENQYLKLFPSANLIFYPKANQFIKLSYAKRINYPDAGQLNPFVDITDSLNHHTGNPNLQPEIIHSFELGYNKDWAKYSLDAIAFYRHSLNTIQQYSIINSNGVILTLPMNFDKSFTYGIESIFTANPVRFYNVNISFSLFEKHINGTDVAEDIANDAFCWYGKLINNFIFWNDSKLQIIGSYNSAVNTPQGKTIAVYTVDMGFQKRLGKSNAHIGIVATDVFNTLKTGVNQNTSTFASRNTSKVDSRAILLTFAWTFNSAFKERLLENKFKEY
jgi:outer membrane receptor protein involved in Fe transport